MTSGTNYRWVTALVAALSVGFVAGLVVPRFLGTTAGWVVTVVLALAAAAAAVVATREKIDDGAHVRDDALDR